MISIRYIILPFIFLTPSVFAQPNLIKGQGLITVDTEKMPTLKFFNTPDAKEPVNIIQIFNDPSIDSYNIKNIKEISKDWFNPLHCHLDYYIFYLQCIDTNDSWYQIVINEKTDLKYWIKKADCLEYITWESFISHVVSVIPIDSNDNPILLSPTPDAQKAQRQLINCLAPVSVDGDWMKVRIEPAVCDMSSEISENEIFDGYIRWRKGNTLLIEYYLLL